MNSTASARVTCDSYRVFSAQTIKYILNTMAAHERRTSNLCASVVIGTLALSCLCVTVTDALSVDENGVIVFDPLPSLGEFRSDSDAYKNDGIRPGLLGDMARGWVDVVQPRGLPLGKYVTLKTEGGDTKSKRCALSRIEKLLTK